MRKKNGKLLLTSLTTIFIGFIFAYSIQITYSALTDHDKKENSFQIGNLNTTIKEEFDPPKEFEPDKEYEKKVEIKNTGSLDSFVRVLALPVITAEADDGTTIVLSATTDGATPILTIDYNLVDWIDGKDGYFYYKKKLVTGEKTAALFSTVKMNKANISEEYNRAKLTFEIKVEGIHTTKYAYRDAWWGGSVPPTGSELAEVDNTLKTQTID
ncbi:hypothetical protein [Enterococcus sp. LJL51]|uniref:hypothetical protein n=1 Tax=Enterococcus sp. LJL51 TaxID=3416656 RepID=UPI003CEB6572